MKKIIILGLLVIIALLAGATIFLQKKTGPTLPKSIAPAEKVVVKDLAPVGKGVAYIKITATGFSPSSIIINTGDKVIWTNSSNSAVQINSDPHPKHNLYPILNLGAVLPGQNTRLVFGTPGTYTYHNHLNPSQTGTIEVK